MQLKPKYCSLCGAEVETREIDGKSREFCPKCEIRVYLNPPPLAACVVLNQWREVLLMKSKRGREEATWTLPQGFVNAGEPIADAAVRQLKEKAGVEGRLLRLLNADSCWNPIHGDLSIITFELEKVGGSETAGQGIEALGYYPPSRCPRLAYPANEKALRVCADSHLEEWMIQDSFERLQGDPTKVMLSDTLVKLIKDGSEELARRWLEGVRSSPSTPTYATVDEAQLLELARRAIDWFSGWLSGEKIGQDLADYYYGIGRERFGQQYANHEILSALMQLKRQIWLYAREHGVWRRPIDAYRVLELNRRIVVFFDKAMYHVTRGFEAGHNA